MKNYTLASAKMNTGNWKTAISGRDRKKRGSDKTGMKPATEHDQSLLVEPSFETPNQFERIAQVQSPCATPSENNGTEDDTTDTTDGSGSASGSVDDSTVAQQLDRKIERAIDDVEPVCKTFAPKQILARPGSKKPTASEPPATSSKKSDSIEKSRSLPNKTAITKSTLVASSEAQPDTLLAMEATSKPTSKHTSKHTWGEMSESADVASTMSAFNSEYAEKCETLKERLAFVSTAVTAMLNVGLKAIQAERVRVGNSKNEKSLVRDLVEICSSGRELVSATSRGIKDIVSTVDSYEIEKNRALDELKNFLATLGVSETKTLGVSETKAAPMVAPLVTKKTPFDGRYAAIVSGVSGDIATPVPVAAATPARIIDMASVPLGLGNLIVPLSRSRNDLQPMGIRFASDLGVFLINLDGKTYSFCNGTFISRTPRSGDNTLFGKRCNPSIARCIGAECTYYHDPLSHASGHTNRNMGVHYVVSELINGVATEKDIIETARGRNKYVVEDIIQLAGMLLIKAFLVKKARDSSSVRAEGDD